MFKHILQKNTEGRQSVWAVALAWIKVRFLSDVKYSIDGVTFSEWVDLKIEQNGKELTNIKLEYLVTQGSPPPL